jgi:hypothetical protein
VRPSQSKKNIQLIAMILFAWALSSCRSEQVENESRLQWGVHQMAYGANLLNLRPTQTVEVCAPKQEWVQYAQEAIQKWSSALGRWGHFQVNPCRSGSTLKINLIPGDELGLNYFTEKPGRIYIGSNLGNKLARAVILHEFGHSFGMCDQYPSNAGKGCSSASSGRLENREIMGTTDPSKTELTQGDIEGVKTAAEKAGAQANGEWQQFLAANPSPSVDPNQNSNGGGLQNQPQNPGSLFAAIGNTSDQSLQFSASSGQNLQVCVLDQASVQAGDCGRGTAVQLNKIGTVGGQDIYNSTLALSHQQGPIFILMISGTTKQKIQISPKTSNGLPI